MPLFPVTSRLTTVALWCSPLPCVLCHFTHLHLQNNASPTRQQDPKLVSGTKITDATQVVKPTKSYAAVTVSFRTLAVISVAAACALGAFAYQVRPLP